MVRILIVAVVWCGTIGAFSSLFAQDSLYYNQADFLATVYRFHPVATQARLLSDVARQQLRFSRGLLDPALKGSYTQKNFKDSRYFETFGTSVEVPFWLGDLKAGFDQNAGSRLNNENFTVPGGVSYLGISIPVLQGLIIDERRTAILQARAFGTIAEGERVKLINKLLLSASKDYWDWAFAFERYRLLQEALGFATFRFNAIRERAFQGDAAFIDTLEAYLQVQNFEQSARQAEVDFRNMGIMLSAYLWDAEGNPVQLAGNVYPDWAQSDLPSPGSGRLLELKTSAEVNHPELVKITGKLGQLEVERRMAAEKFKPRLDVNYSYLWGGFNVPATPEINARTWDNSAKFGLDYKIPILFRNERAKWQLARLKIRETELERTQLNRDIQNQIEATYNELSTQERLKTVQDQIVVNNTKLRDAELRRFENGESSLFLINTRDVTLVNSRLKLFEIKAKYAKNLIQLQWAAGTVEVVAAE